MSLLAIAIAAASAGGASDAGTLRVLPNPNVYQPPAHCRDVAQQVAQRQRRNVIVPRRLGDLPPGALQYAVNRTINGCAVPTPVGYRQDYLLPGAADAPEFQPAGERSRKR